MACKNICKMCNRLVVSTTITVAAGEMIITLPAGAYLQGEKYCLVLAQAIPADAVDPGLPVVIQTTGDTTDYPLLDKAGLQVTADQLRTRTRYATRIYETLTGSAFRLIGCLLEGGYNE